MSLDLCQVRNIKDYLSVTGIFNINLFYSICMFLLIKLTGTKFIHIMKLKTKLKVMYKSEQNYFMYLIKNVKYFLLSIFSENSK